MIKTDSQEYWNNRFIIGNWGNAGSNQKREYAKANVAQIDISSDFKGTILDFGCALGDAIPIYKSKFPFAKIKGYDISTAAIEICKNTFGSIAEFFSGNIEDIPSVDVIFASHVMEHIDGDILYCQETIN